VGTNHYLFVTHPDPFDALVKENRWLLKDRSMVSKLHNLSDGDEVLVYVAGQSGIIGLLRVQGPSQLLRETAVLSGRAYQYELPVAFEIAVPKECVVPVKPFVRELNVTRRIADNWGSAFQRSIVRLNDDDFNFLKTKLVQTYKELHASEQRQA